MFSKGQTYKCWITYANNVNTKAMISNDRGLFDQNSLDRNFDNQLTEFLDAFQLIKTFNNYFGQTPKFKAFDRIIRSTA